MRRAHGAITQHLLDTLNEHDAVALGRYGKGHQRQRQAAWTWASFSGMPAGASADRRRGWSRCAARR